MAEVFTLDGEDLPFEPGDTILQAAQAKLQLVGGRRVHVDQPLVQLRPVHQPRGTPEPWHGRIVRVQRKLYTVFLCDGQHIVKEILKPVPKLLLRDGSHKAAVSRRVGHIPNLTVRDG